MDVLLQHMDAVLSGQGTVELSAILISYFPNCERAGQDTSYSPFRGQCRLKAEGRQEKSSTPCSHLDLAVDGANTVDSFVVRSKKTFEHGRADCQHDSGVQFLAGATKYWREVS